MAIDKQVNNQKLSKDVGTLPRAINYVDLMDTYSTAPQRHAEYIFSYSACGTFNKTHQAGGHETNLNKLKIIEIIQTMFSDYRELMEKITV